MPVDWSKYSPFWKTIRAHILERDGNRCKFCGVPNGATILRSSIDPAKYIWYDEANDVHCYPDGEWIKLSEIPEEYEITRQGEIRLYTTVVLTVAHLDHTTTNDADDNLAALCQRCHLIHDKDQRITQAAYTRRIKFEERQPALPGLETGENT